MCYTCQNQVVKTCPYVSPMLKSYQTYIINRYLQTLRFLKTYIANCYLQMPVFQKDCPAISLFNFAVLQTGGI